MPGFLPNLSRANLTNSQDVRGRILVTAENPRFRKFVRAIRRNAQELLRTSRKNKASLAINLVDKRFMDKNVLAFPAPKGFPRPDLKGEFLGEIYLNPDYIKKERLEVRGWRLEVAEHKLVYMLIHGFLHLLGYDHKKRNDRIRMEKKERLLLKKLAN